jgi:sulfate permease, SulP family
VLRPTTGDLSGAVADLGVLVPLTAALVLVNGLDPGSVLLAAGILVLASGVGFGMPFPVQPLKALTALAVAQSLSDEVLHAAGLQIGLLLVVLAVTGLADRLSRIFTKPVIRSLQFGVGILLIASAVKLLWRPPELFEGGPSPSWGLVLAAATVLVVAVAGYRRWYALSAVLLGVGIAVTWVTTSPDVGGARLDVPVFSLPPLSAFGTAFALLVIPQIPLTFGNAVVGVSDLAHEHFGDRARRVTPGRVALSCGAGNVASALIGGMPMCHGSSGLSAHIRLGARTAAMNVLLGTTLVTLGVVFSDQVLALFALLPVWVLAGFLAYAGLRHAMLVLDLRGAALAMAVGAGALGIWTGNLAWTTAVALAVAHAPKLPLFQARSGPAHPGTCTSRPFQRTGDRDRARHTLSR